MNAVGRNVQYSARIPARIPAGLDFADPALEARRRIVLPRKSNDRLREEQEFIESIGNEKEVFSIDVLGHGEEHKLKLGPIQCPGLVRNANIFGHGHYDLISFRGVDIQVREASLTCSSCSILHLSIFGSRNTILDGCKIGILHIHNLITGALVLRNCEIGELRISGPFEPQSVWLSKAKISVSRERAVASVQRLAEYSFAPELNRDSVARLYTWAARHNDSATAHFTRGVELAIERSYSSGFERIFLNLWWLFAGFGLLLWLPLLWVFIAAVVSFFIGYFDCFVLGYPEDNYTGWRSLLLDESDGSRFFRSIVAVFEGVLSPLNIFGLRQLVVPSSFYSVIAQVFLGYFVLLMLALFGFSVRRRFRSFN